MNPRRAFFLLPLGAALVPVPATSVAVASGLPLTPLDRWDDYKCCRLDDPPRVIERDPCEVGNECIC
ncbi:MAG: hypothetical protein ACYDCK_08155 [Thermoplasmatota archaeon]